MRVIVNGREVAGFLRGEVVLNVKTGDLINVDNPDPSRPVVVVVSKKTEMFSSRYKTAPFKVQNHAL